MIDNATELELTVLEDLLNDDCKCQSDHNYVPVCSQVVTHIANGSCADRPVLICLNVATEHLRFMRINGPCSGCLRPASECWSIRPV